MPANPEGVRVGPGTVGPQPEVGAGASIRGAASKGHRQDKEEQDEKQTHPGRPARR